MTNMGTTDRLVRLVAGVALLVAVLAAGVGGEGWLRWLLLAVGAILTLTAVVGTCPAYMPFGIRTCRKP
jgi:hypothetical protein